MGSNTTTRTAHRWSRAAKPDVRSGTFSNGIAYDTIGTGPRTAIFLPGGPGIVPMAWRRIGRTLLEPLAAGGCTVWRLTRGRDLPAGHTLPDMADDVAQVIEENFGGRVDAVIGLSMGGMITQLLAARHPDAMDRVVLLSAATGAQAGMRAPPPISSPSSRRRRVRPRLVRRQRILPPPGSASRLETSSGKGGSSCSTDRAAS